MADTGHDRRWLSACGHDGECVEVCFEGEQVLVRGSRDPDGPMLTFTAAEWRNFVAAIRAGEFSG